MAIVTMEYGLTLKIHKDSGYEFIRPTIKIEVDTEKDVAKQIDDAIIAAGLIWKNADDFLEKRIQETIGTSLKDALQDEEVPKEKKAK